MKKKDFMSLLIGMAATLVFGIGLCMCLIPEWNAFRSGVIVAAAGGATLLALAIARWVMAGRPAPRVDGRLLARVFVGAAGALTLGVGMCMAMVWEMFIPGMIVGVAGIAILLMLIPMIAGLK